MSKFVGKFRKNRNYNDDYNYDNKRHRNEHSESKKQLQRMKSEEWDGYFPQDDSSEYHSEAQGC